jgi:hypothetical protein
VASRQLAACRAVAKQRLIEGISRSYSSFHILSTNEKGDNGQREETENKFHRADFLRRPVDAGLWRTSRPIYARDLVITGGYVGQGTQRTRRLTLTENYLFLSLFDVATGYPLVKPLAFYLRVLCVFVVNIPFSLS